jgi:exocyst complex component 4
MEYRRRFHALLKTYDQLSELILHTIRIDVRCRVAHYLNLAMRHVSVDNLAISSNPDPTRRETTA